MARAALALPFSGLSGSLGETSIVQRPDGPVVRARVYRPRKLTPGQRDGADRMAVVSSAWGLLDDATFSAWKRYAESRSWRNAATGAIVRPKAFNLFCGLACRARQVDPGLDLSSFAPPARPFLGDAVVVDVTLSFRSGERKGSGDGESGMDDDSGTPSPTVLPSARASLQGEPSPTFTSSGANSPGVVTELLAQPLVNARRAVYKEKYVSQGFVAFEGAESVEVPLKAGAWALAYCFRLAATGQETEIVELGVVRV